MNVNVTHNESDNPEDNSLENTCIIMKLTGEEVARLNELRGGDTVIEYVRRVMDVTCAPEYVQAAERDHKRPFDTLSARAVG